jgi:hypothetical protein
VGGFIKPNDRLTALERIEIYNRMYWFRVLDCLYDDCPGLRAVLGVQKFMRVYVAVHRHDNQIYFKRLEPAAYRLLKALQQGETLARACAIALPRSASSAPAWQQRIRGWFQNWAEWGWFCRP